MARRDDLVARVEWAFGIVAAVAVLAIIGFLLLEGTGRSDAPPELAVERSPDAAAPPGQLRFVVANRGGRAARSVTVSLRLGDERRAVTIDDIPADAEARGGFLLPPGADPGSAVLEVESYLDP